MLSAIIYIHGFNSSSKSVKAQQFCQRFAQLGLAKKGVSLSVPDLHFAPQTAIAQLIELVEAQQGKPILLVGSSLGGYYSIYLAQRYANCRAVLINPAVYPYRLLADLLGENQNIYSAEKYVLETQHIAQLEALDIEKVSDPTRYLLLSQTGDETLDYREAVEKLADVEQDVQQGGDHSYANFEREIDRIIAFGQGEQWHR